MFALEIGWWGAGGGTATGGRHRRWAQDNLVLSVWKEAYPLVKRIIKPYLTPNYFFFLKHAAAKQCPSLPSCDPLIVLRWLPAGAMPVDDDVFTVPEPVPALPDHHAEPDPGLAAVLCAFLPHCRGKWPVDRLLYQTVGGKKKRSMNSSPPLPPSPSFISCYTERPFGDPANVELQ